MMSAIPFSIEMTTLIAIRERRRVRSDERLLPDAAALRSGLLIESP